MSEGPTRNPSPFAEPPSATPEPSFEPLTPTAFLERSGFVFADRPAVVDGSFQCTYGEFRERAKRLAGALAQLGVTDGARVAVLSPNTHVLLEAHYGVPLAGAVLVAMNWRLTPEELAYIVEHSGSMVVLYDHGLVSDPSLQRSNSLP